MKVATQMLELAVTSANLEARLNKLLAEVTAKKKPAKARGRESAVKQLEQQLNAALNALGDASKVLWYGAQEAVSNDVDDTVHIPEGGLTQMIIELSPEAQSAMDQIVRRLQVQES